MSSMIGQNSFGAMSKPQKVGGNTGYRSSVSQQFTPEQMNLFQKMFSQVGDDSYLSKLSQGDEEAFGQLEAPALKQFSGIQGGLASRFSGMGGTGARKSSGFQNTQNSAAQDFASQLQSQRMGIQRQAQQDLFSMSRDLLGQRPYEQNFFQEQQKAPSFWEQLLGAVGNAGSQAASYAGSAALAGI